ncbi:hypothetical protein BY458DRAFT_585806 [Sporodiniella umbellata]|nr:hypothetical protein BY458DRAFT_585806 [Sporodiniella umbellata]
MATGELPISLSTYVSTKSPSPSEKSSRKDTIATLISTNNTDTSLSPTTKLAPSSASNQHSVFDTVNSKTITSISLTKVVQTLTDSVKATQTSLANVSEISFIPHPSSPNTVNSVPSTTVTVIPTATLAPDLEPEGRPTGSIIGGVIGGAIGLSLVIAAFVLLRRYLKQRTTTKSKALYNDAFYSDPYDPNN